jgi:condensin complex subunit 1
VLCSTIIKNLSERAFQIPEAIPVKEPVPAVGEADEGEAQPEAGPSSPRKETLASMGGRRPKTSSFKLAQLIFVVGHVAIKHIVYLELVEREFKRRKDEVAKGGSHSSIIEQAILRLTITVTSGPSQRRQQAN